MKVHEANRRQLEIWKRTMAYELGMMAPQSLVACKEFLSRLERFEKQLDEKEQNAKELIR